MVKEERFSQYIVIIVAIVAVVGIVVMIAEQAKTWEQDILGQAVQTATTKSKSKTATSTTIDMTTLETFLESSPTISSIASNIETLEDRVVVLEEQVSDLEQTVSELSSEGSGISRGERSSTEEDGCGEDPDPLCGQGYF